ncbi:ribonuclease T2 [Hyphomicrobium sp.]|uniref:ribonuclease T2 n=1 Tax=Hyphomicrobium sp. TaxID=82 RepID=UPI002D7729DD|nr:ribonuclease T2 [Hyphomicrobium sp.]HET6389171.1 ribonuclease T2 [Hyphomicrobium sp.]
MLRPHLLLTILVFALLGLYIAFFVAGHNSALPPDSLPSGTGAGSGSSGSDERADNYDYDSGSQSNRGGHDSDVPGRFDYYSLVLSWSPSYCADRGRDDGTQCNRRDGRRYSFVLHGLWPQYENGYPSDCRLPRRPFVPDPVINSMLDIMPSRGLVIHEYRKHGTCSGLDPAQYFATSRRLFESITIPERFRNPMEAQTVPAADVEREFLRANPQFGPGMIAVVCGGSGGSLREVRFCLSRDGKPRDCGRNETKRKLCRANQVFIPPARSTKDDRWGSERAGPPNGNAGSTVGSSPLPGPRMDYDYGRVAQ